MNNTLEEILTRRLEQFWRFSMKTHDLDTGAIEEAPGFEKAMEVVLPKLIEEIEKYKS